MTESEFRTKMVRDMATVLERTKDFPRVKDTVQAMKGAMALLAALFPVTVGVVMFINT